MNFTAQQRQTLIACGVDVDHVTPAELERFFDLAKVLQAANAAARANPRDPIAHKLNTVGRTVEVEEALYARLKKA